MIYLHVPFCCSRCTYCGFYSNTVPEPCRRAAQFEDYAEAVIAEATSRCWEIALTSSVNTLYIGGGTPSVLPFDVLTRIIEHLTLVAYPPEGAVAPNPSRFALRPVSPPASHPFMMPWAATGSATTPPAGGVWEEFTIEVNPEDIVEKGENYVRGLLELGVNRISMGVQSFDDRLLRWMNRRHDAAAAVRAFGILRNAGVENISIDLIFGIPRMDEYSWCRTIERALELAPEHISAYQLSVEEGSALERMASAGLFEEAPEEECRRQYDLLCTKLGEAGYHHYEVSNFALPCKEAIHNSAYWKRVPYVGLGPGAHSFSGISTRSWNDRTLPRRLSDGCLETYSREEEHLSAEDGRIERLMLALRTDGGLPEEELMVLADGRTVDRLLQEGALEKNGPRIRIPEGRFFVSDEIIRELV